jgi:hypothetical protein
MSNSTVLTLLAFTIEHYVAICHPALNGYRLAEKISKRVFIILAIVWILAIITALPASLYITSHSLFKNYCSGYNSEYLPKNWINIYFDLSAVLFFIVPMIVLFVLYILIGLRLRSDGRHLQQETGGVNQDEASRLVDSNRKNTILMLGKHHKAN